MSDRDFLEAGVDFDRANAARMYDYYLGGAHNFAVDRDRADAVITVQPHTVFMAQANRAFLGRVVRWCLDQGIDQFLDLGSGVPTVGNVHEIAHQHQPHARVAYVDFEPVAVAHATEIIAELDTTAVTITRADARDPDSVLHAPGVADLLDFTRPVALLAVAVLQFIEGDMTALLDQYRRSLPPGSVIAISHASDDQPDPTFVEAMRSMRDAYSGSATPLVLRDRAELLAAFHDLELVDPGLVDTTEWPSPQSGTKSWMYGAVARLPVEAPES